MEDGRSVDGFTKNLRRREKTLESPANDAAERRQHHWLGMAGHNDLVGKHDDVWVEPQQGEDDWRGSTEKR